MLKMSLIGVLTFCALVVMVSAAEQRYYDVEKAPEYFAKFVKDFSRTYKNEADKATHYAAFVKNLKGINKSNAENPSASFGINEFADYTDEEQKHMNGFNKHKRYPLL